MMMLQKLTLYFHTVRHLKPGQIFWRIGKHLGWKCALGRQVNRASQCCSIGVLEELDYDSAFLRRFSVQDLLNDRVCFLHESESFAWDAPWHFEDRSPLWNFNLHYFEFLHPLTCRFLQTGERAYLDKTVQSIRGWIRQNPRKNGGNGWSAYTISLRLTNWMAYYSTMEKHLEPAFRQELEDSIFEQYGYLSTHLERDILGNHYFENLKALVLCALFFEDRDALPVFVREMKKQCREQILADGMHFERSPMYHKIVLEGVLRCAVALREAGQPDTQLEEILQAMLNVVYSMEAGLSRIPLFNDSGDNVAKSLDGLLAAAKRYFGMVPTYRSEFPEAGYYLFSCGPWKLLVDAGPVGPSYIPGHAHCDAMSFELFRDGAPILVNCGTYGYQCRQRGYFRSTQAHNTVQIAGTEQSELWSAFRVARRSETKVLSHSESGICMELTDYRGNRIRRELRLTEDALLIKDSAPGKELCSYIHSTRSQPISTNGEAVPGEALYAPEYGALQTVQQITVTGTGELEISIPLI